MNVRGKVNVEVEVSPLDAVKSLKTDLGFTEHITLLPAGHPNNTFDSEKDALYYVTDESYHGSPRYVYNFITSAEERVELYKAVCRIENYLKMNKQ